MELQLAIVNWACGNVPKQSEMLGKDNNFTGNVLTSTS